METRSLKAAVSPGDDINFYSVGHISENPKVTHTFVRIYVLFGTNAYCKNYKVSVLNELGEFRNC